MLCGLNGRFDAHLAHVRNVIGAQGRRAHDGGDERADAGAAHAVHHRHLRQRGAQRRGTGRHRADGRRRGAALRHAAQGGLLVALDLRLIVAPRGAAHARGARPVREARPGIECDGEMHGDAALSETVRRGYLPETTLSGSANLLVLPNLDAANILFNVLKMTGGHGVTVGPILLGRGEAGAHPHRVGDGAAGRQHDGAGGGGCGGCWLTGGKRGVFADQGLTLCDMGQVSVAAWFRFPGPGTSRAGSGNRCGPPSHASHGSHRDTSRTPA